jgi:bifunctional non-homologous end joining protein LigD
MLPHLAGRPLSLERFRATIDDGGFYQQQVGKHFPPDVVGRVAVARHDGAGEVVHPLAESADALVYLANQGALTLHAWPARLPALEHPDALVLDLDPDGDAFAPVRRAAALLREVLDELGLRAVPMLTGSRGVHVVVPLDATLGWDGVWTMAKAIGAAHVARAPKELTRAFYKSQRRGRLYVDTGRARRGHTAVVPYTVRARPGAPVAAPVTWAELLDEDLGLHARSFTVRDVLDRPEDPWEGARSAGQSLRGAAAALGVALDEET